MDGWKSENCCEVMFVIPQQYIHSSGCADRVCTMSVPDHGFMAALWLRNDLFLFLFLALLPSVVVTEQIGPMS